VLLRLGGARNRTAVAHAVDRSAPVRLSGNVGSRVAPRTSPRRGRRYRGPMDALPLVVSGGWAAGVNAYATVLLLGVFGRLGLGDVPDGLERTEVMIAAGVLFAVEFVADKIPYVDNVWDAIHTAVRPAIAAVIGVLLNDQADGLHDALAAVGSSATALASHGIKASLRLVVNVSPDPVTTAAASLAEDSLVVCVVALIVTQPWVALALSLALLATGATVVVLLWRRVRSALTRRRAGRGPLSPERSAGS